MKEIVVIPKDDLVYIKPKYNKMERYIKVPETFEELKELCKGICEFRKGARYEFILVKTGDNCLWFSSDGTIEFPMLQYKVIEDLTPQQMWQIIKSLIGAE